MVMMYGNDSDVTYLVDTYDFHFLPIVNPDGYVYTFTDVSIVKRIQTASLQWTKVALLAFMGISRKNIRPMKSCEMKHEIILFHTMGPSSNVLFQTHLLCVTTYGLVWSSSVKLLT